MNRDCRKNGNDFFLIFFLIFLLFYQQQAANAQDHTSRDHFLSSTVQLHFQSEVDSGHDDESRSDFLNGKRVFNRLFDDRS